MGTIFGPKTFLPQDSPAISLLEENDTGRHVYISHIDRSPLRTKKAVFAIVLLKYIAFSTIMIWRIGENYDLLARLLNDFYYVETGVPKRMKYGFWSWGWMFMVALFDYYLFSTLHPPLCTFIAGHLWFRCYHGFHEAEVIFRAPTGRAYDDMLRLPPSMFQHLLQTSLFHATNPRLILGSTGFNTSCPPWELCYTASMDAYQLAKDGIFDLENWDLSLWQKDEDQRWTVCEMWRSQGPSLSAMTVNIMIEKLRAQGNERFIAKWETFLVEWKARLAASPVPNPALEFARSANALFTAEGLDYGERWIEAMAEVNRINNQPQQPQ